MLNLFDQYKVKKKIRLIELFAGYGSQALALKNLNIPFEHYEVIEFDKFAIKTYNALHQTSFETRDIRKVQDLQIVDKENYEYILTYSFPCTDLSLAGKKKGMQRNSNTSSSLLWEVERLLKNNNLPQILVMENVPQIHNRKNKKDFMEWVNFLGHLGYQNHITDLNAKDYGVPQTRKRTFMVSILGEYEYHFPKKKKLRLKLADLLEDNVSEEFFISDNMIRYFTDNKYRNGLVRSKQFRPHTQSSKYAYSITTNTGNRPSDNFIIVPENTKKGYQLAYAGDGVYIDRPSKKRGVVQKGIIQTLKTTCQDIGVVVVGNYSPSKHNASRVIDQNGIAPTVMENHGTVTAIYQNLKIRKLTPRECFRLMGLKDYQIDKIINIHSKTQLYKQAGNSIVVPVLEAIFSNLIN